MKTKENDTEISYTKERVFAMVDLEKCTNIDFDVADGAYSVSKEELLEWLEGRDKSNHERD